MCFLEILRIPASLLHLIAPHLYPIPYILHRGAMLCPYIHIARIYAHTYAHTAKRCLDPPRATLFGAQHREGVVQFPHAPHTATSSSAITLTKTRMHCIICILAIALHERIRHQAHHAYTSMPVYNRLRYFQCECARSFIACMRSFIASVLERICNFGASVPEGSDTLPRSQ